MKIMGPVECTCKADTTGIKKECWCERGLINIICRIFVGDGVIYSKEEEQHIGDLAEVFKRLTANGITLKPSKCVWAVTELPILGHVVMAGVGIKADPSKVKAIVDTDRPTDVAALKLFVGMCSYLQKFLPFFAEYATPLRDIIKKYPGKAPANITSEWSTESIAGFERIKLSVASAAILRFPDFNKPFIILVDICNRATGAALAQLDEVGTEQPICHTSAALDNAQRNDCLRLVPPLGNTVYL